jgi:Tol biopolymer transport system component
MPVWSPHGSRLAYATGSLQHPVVTTGPAEGTGAAVALPCPPGRRFPTDWSRDGRWVLATVYTPTAADVWLLDAGGGTPHPLLAQSFVERDARFSPDGSYVAYVSEETGRAEIAVQRVDGDPQRDVISVSGGTAIRRLPRPVVASISLTGGLSRPPPSCVSSSGGADW